ncbi:MAG: biotin synthase BioB [Alphaproteobacteria bacterium]|nr:biotin synthase BioB [Alphaproteobacteria bacterium]
MALSSKDIIERTGPQVPQAEIRHDWTLAEAEALFSKPFNDLLFNAQSLHRKYFAPNEVQISTLLSIKTGGCPEDCAYCPQSAHYDTDTDRDALMDIDSVLAAAREAKRGGASRFCMGAAWRSPTDRDLDAVCKMVEGVKDLGLESCVTLGMLREEQAKRLSDSGLDYYNHNVDTSEEYYSEIITTRTYEDRLNTLGNVRDAGINVCSGGIVGMGETPKDRAGMLTTLASLPEHPQSVPINMLVAVEGTPLSETPAIDAIEFARTIAVARVMMPASVVRLSAGRNDMTDEAQALCFAASANSIFYGDVLLTTDNPEREADMVLFDRLGLKPSASTT